jgi:hypothetical protein
MKAADLLTVGSIAEQPSCVDSHKPLSEIREHAVNQGYDWMPVRDDDGMIRQLVETKKLKGLEKFSEVKDQARKVTVADLVGTETPIFSILKRLQDRPFLLCLGRSGIDGIVTPYDLNQPAAHYFGFALAIVIESEMARAIEKELVDDEEIARIAEEEGVGKKWVTNWREAKQSSTQPRLVNLLSFGDKITLLKRAGASPLMARCSALHFPEAISIEKMLAYLREVLDLRDAVAHEKPTLHEHSVMFQRLRIAHSLAHAFTAEAE